MLLSPLSLPVHYPLDRPRLIVDVNREEVSWPWFVFALALEVDLPPNVLFLCLDVVSAGIVTFQAGVVGSHFDRFRLVQLEPSFLEE
jgi:hypothetical protein